MTLKNWQINAGYQPGLIGRVVQLHGLYYVGGGTFGPEFEAQVAGGMADFVPRLDDPRNQTWTATSKGQIEGGLSIDGQDLSDGVAHLRWFILSDALRGLGAGQALMQAAMTHCDHLGFHEVQLWTFAGLDAARTLYERHGFTLINTTQGDQWGRMVQEQLWVRQAP